MTPFDIQKEGYCKLEELYGKDIYYYPYARYAFYELLSKLDIKSIYLPSFICRDMLSPLNTLGVKYYFYDLNEDFSPILMDITCDAILMINYFGFANNLEVFIQYKIKNNAILIEDNAHGFLSKDEKNTFLGLRGDFGLLSMRKTVFIPNGGALLVNNPKYKLFHFKSSKVLHTFEDDNFLKKLKVKKKLFNKYMGITIVLVRRWIRYLKTGSTIPLPDSRSEIELPKNSCLTPLLKDGVLNLDIIYEVNRRKNLYLEVEKWAQQFNIEPIFKLDNNSVPFEFAFIDNGQSEVFEKFLFQKGFFILPWPDLPEEIISNSPSFYFKVKVVPFLW